MEGRPAHRSWDAEGHLRRDGLLCESAERQRQNAATCSNLPTVQPSVSPAIRLRTRSSAAGIPLYVRFALAREHVAGTLLLRRLAEIRDSVGADAKLKESAATLVLLIRLTVTLTGLTALLILALGALALLSPWSFWTTLRWRSWPPWR